MILNADTAVTAGWLDRLATRPRPSRTSRPSRRSRTSARSARCRRRSIDAFGLDGADAADRRLRRVRRGRTSLGLRPEVITGVGFCMYVTRARSTCCGGFRRGDVRPGLRRGGRLLPAGVTARLPPPRRGLDVRVSTAAACRSATDRQAGLEPGVGAHAARPLSVLPPDQPAGARRGSAGRAVRRARARRCDERRPEPPTRAPRPAQPARRARRHREAPAHPHRGARPTSSTSRSCFPVELGLRAAHASGRSDGRPVEHEFLLPGAPRPGQQARRRGRRVRAWPHVLDMFDFDAVHVHNLIGHSLAPLDVLADFDGPVVCSVHDLYLACPNHWLLYQEPLGVRHPRRPLGLRAAACRRPRASTVESPRGVPGHGRRAPRRGRPLGVREPERGRLLPPRLRPRHRSASSSSSTARSSTSTRPRRRSTPDLIFDEPSAARLRRPGLAEEGARRGQLAGRRLARHRHRDPPLRPAAGTRRRPSLHLHGPYDNELLPELLDRAGHPGRAAARPYAETFGHVMTEAFVAGRPVIGALRRAGRAHPGHGRGLDDRPRRRAAGAAAPTGSRRVSRRASACHAGCGRCTDPFDRGHCSPLPRALPPGGSR